jgi:cellulose synthase (UDP-forming)
MLATVSFPIYARALVNVLVGRDQKWHVTGRRGRPSSPFNFMVPQVLMFTFLLLTSAVSVWRDIGHSQLTLATVWNITNTVILGVFVVAGMREHRRLLHPSPDVAPTSRQATARTRATVSARTAVARPSAPEPEPALSAPVPALSSANGSHASLTSNSGASS